MTVMTQVRDKTIIISVAKEFCNVPGPRFKWQGAHSGEEFLEKLLKPKYNEAVRSHQQLTVDLDGTEGYSSAFLDGSFGELAREFGKGNVQKVIRLVANDEPYLKKEIDFYMSSDKK